MFDRRRDKDVMEDDAGGWRGRRRVDKDAMLNGQQSHFPKKCFQRAGGFFVEEMYEAVYMTHGDGRRHNGRMVPRRTPCDTGMESKLQAETRKEYL